MTELYICPRCKCQKPQIYKGTSGIFETWYRIKCPVCNLTTSMWTTQEEAVEEWNRRTMIKNRRRQA